MGKKDSYKFVDRATSNKSKVAFGCSILSLCIQLGLIYKAIERTPTVMEGLIGFYAFILSIIAVIFMVGSMIEDKLYSKYQIITTVLTVGVFILNGLMYALGI